MCRSVADTPPFFAFPYSVFNEQMPVSPGCHARSSHTLERVGVGGPYRVRTGDPELAKLVLYQLS